MKIELNFLLEIQNYLQFHLSSVDDDVLAIDLLLLMMLSMLDVWRLDEGLCLMLEIGLGFRMDFCG